MGGRWLLELAAGGVLAALAAVAAEGSAHAQEGRTLTIGAVMKLARDRAAVTREASASADMASRQATAALGGYMPSATLRVSGQNNWQQANVVGRTGDLVGVTGESALGDVTGSVSWTVWDSMRTASNVASARASARAAMARSSAAQLSTAALGALAFLDVVFDDERVEVARTTVKLRERHAALAHGLVVSGIRPPVEEARALVQLEAAKAELISFEARRAQDKVELATLLQLDPTMELKLVRPAVLPTVADDAKRAAEEALRQRPEIRAASEDVRARDEAVSAANAARLPTVTLHGSAGSSLTRTDVDPRFLQGRNGTVGVTISVPLFDWTVWSRPAVERASLANAEARASGEVARVRGEAATAAYRTRAARALLEQAKKAAEVAAATLAVVEKRYQNGLASPLELLDSGTSDALARRQLVDAELELASATVQTLAATGRLTELER